jgi:hypothetical protein
MKCLTISLIEFRMCVHHDVLLDASYTLEDSMDTKPGWKNVGLSPLDLKTERKNYRLSKFDAKLLRVAARLTANGNENFWFHRHIWRDACELLGSEFFGNLYRPAVLEAMFLFAFRKTVEPPPESETATRWLERAMGVLDQIGEDPFTKESQQAFTELMQAYPLSWLAQIAGAHNEAAAAFSKITGLPIPDEINK